MKLTGRDILYKMKKALCLQGFKGVENIGVEPMTFWLPAKRSSQLS